MPLFESCGTTIAVVSPSRRSQRHAANLISKASLSCPASVHFFAINKLSSPFRLSFVPSLSFNLLLHRSPFFSYRCSLFFFFPPPLGDLLSIYPTLAKTFSPLSRQNQVGSAWQHETPISVPSAKSTIYIFIDALGTSLPVFLHFTTSISVFLLPLSKGFNVAKVSFM
jgi:hypothetical protein